VEIGLRAAETGHLVLSTLHTTDVGQTVNRILGLFEHEEERQIRTRFADAMRWIVCQRLLPRVVGGGRIAAFEIMGSSLRAKDCIVQGEAEGRTFYEIIQAGHAFGMMTFDQCISRFYRDNLITEETAVTYASRKPIIRRAVDSFKSSRGEKTTTIEDLTVDTDYGKRGGI